MDLEQEKKIIEERIKQREQEKEQEKADRVRLEEIKQERIEEQKRLVEEKKRAEERLIIDRIEKGLSPIYLKIGRDYVEASKYLMTRDRQIILCAEHNQKIKFAHLEDNFLSDTGSVFVEKYWLNAKK